VPDIFFKSPKDLVDEWPEVFNDLYMNTMPIEYLKILQIEFRSGMIWEVNIQDQIKTHGSKKVINLLESTLKDYKQEVKNFDFKVDVTRLKTDIVKSTKRLL
jgi:hypothetical protein